MSAPSRVVVLDRDSTSTSSLGSSSSDSPPPPPHPSAAARARSASSLAATALTPHSPPGPPLSPIVSTSTARPDSKTAAGPHHHRRGRWTRAEHAEVLRVGDAARPGEAWTFLRKHLHGDARLRSAAALKNRYIQLVRMRDGPHEENDGEEEEMHPTNVAARDAHHTEDLYVDLVDDTEDGSEPEDADDLVIVSSIPAPAPTQNDGVPPPPPPLRKRSNPPAHAPQPWSLDEDAALLAAVATPPLGPTTWTAVHALIGRIYSHGLGAGRVLTRSERETRDRWEKELSRGAASPARWPLDLIPALTAIHERLTRTLQAQLDTLDPHLAAQLRQPAVAAGAAGPPPPDSPHRSVERVPHAANKKAEDQLGRGPNLSSSMTSTASGRAAPPFPTARASPVLVRPTPSPTVHLAAAAALGPAAAWSPTSRLPPHTTLSSALVMDGYPPLPPQPQEPRRPSSSWAWPGSPGAAGERATAGEMEWEGPTWIGALARGHTLFDGGGGEGGLESGGGVGGA